MKILYFARIRQIAGRSSEEVEVPASVATVADLIDYLSARDESRCRSAGRTPHAARRGGPGPCGARRARCGRARSGLLPARHGRLMRLNVYLQKAGIGSRREAERLVADGRVSVNGVTALATTPVEEGDAVTVDGKPVAPETKPLPRLFMLHKPDRRAGHPPRPQEPPDHLRSPGAEPAAVASLQPARDECGPPRREQRGPARALLRRSAGAGDDEPGDGAVARSTACACAAS